MEIIPGGHRTYEFHKGQAADKLGPTRCQVKSQRSAPILSDEISAFDTQAVDKPIQEARVVFESIRDRGLVRFAESNEIRRDAESGRRNFRDDVAPYVRRRWIAVQEECNGLRLIAGFSICDAMS